MAKTGPAGGVCYKEGHCGNPKDGFGRSTFNPVLCSSFHCALFYLDRLESLNGENLLYVRYRAHRVENGRILDCYRITKEGEPDSPGFDLYIDVYAQNDSRCAPSGCRLRRNLSAEMKIYKSN